MAPAQLSLDLADLEIETLDLLPTTESVGAHEITEIGASSCGSCCDCFGCFGCFAIRMV
jgi:hypothetical protein